MNSKNINEHIIFGGALMLIGAIGALSMFSKVGIAETLLSLHVGNSLLISILIGSIFFVAAHSITKVDWHNPLKEQLKIWSFVLLAVLGLFLVIVVFGKETLPWNIQESKGFKRTYLSLLFFALRTILALTVSWFALKILATTKSTRFISVFIVFSFLALCLMGWDWVVAFIPDWYSSLFAWIFVVIGFQLSVALFILRSIFSKVDSDKLLSNLGRYLFTSSIFFGYLWYSQNMLTWYGNLPAETNLMITLWQNPISIWAIASVILIVVVPMGILFSPKAKRKKNLLIIASASVIFGQWLNILTLLKSRFDTIYIFKEFIIFLGFVGFIILLFSIVKLYEGNKIYT